MSAQKLTVLRLSQKHYSNLATLAAAQGTTVELMLEKKAIELAATAEPQAKTNVQTWIELALKKIRKLPKGTVFKSTDYLPEGVTFKEKMDFGKLFLTVIENGNHYSSVVRKPGRTTLYVR